MNIKHVYKSGGISMSEAIIARGGKTSGSSSGSGSFITEIFTKDTIWLVPTNIKNKQIDVRIFGGGGGGLTIFNESNNKITNVCAGGGGWMNNKLISVTSGEIIEILIGRGGTRRIINLTTQFYDYLNFPNTNGGTTFFGTYLSANGGSGGSSYGGGNGGAGGGTDYYNGGTGYQFGGGSGYFGGNGGIWGGGGAGGYHMASNTAGIGGTYGGNGSYHSNNAENGTNTIGWVNVSKYINDNYMTGTGKGGKGGRSGGGGFGGCGGNNYGGGGGYAANGGNNYGGGGGYGKGGYGGSGINSAFSNNYNVIAGGGGSYGHGGSYNETPTFGGGGSSFQNGADGICIIQYYIEN